MANLHADMLLAEKVLLRVPAMETHGCVLVGFDKIGSNVCDRGGKIQGCVASLYGVTVVLGHPICSFCQYYV